MQTLQQKRKIAFSFGVLAAVSFAGMVLALLSTLPVQTNESESPNHGMPASWSNAPEFIVGEESPEIGMLVPNSNTPEMIVDGEVPAFGMVVPGTIGPDYFASPME